MAGSTDKRDSRTWVVFELTRLGEIKAEEGVLDGLLAEALDVERDQVFVPSTIYTHTGSRVAVHLMEGYAFAMSGLPDGAYLALEGTCPYVKKVLTVRNPSGGRTLSVIPDANVQEMRQQLGVQVSDDLVAGMEVTVTDGVYGNLEGEIVEVDGEDAHVRFTLRSLDLITRIPRVILAPKGDE
jgi:transcription antitermination factor NusG